jgi:hypothetical protein
VIPHAFAIGDIALWIIHWLLQKILDIVPLLSPMAESPSPPAWWFYHYSYFDWSYELRAGNIPSSTLIDRALAGLWLTLGDWIDEVGTYVRRKAQDYTRAVTGYVPSGFSTLSDWSGWLQNLIGSYVPGWTSSLAAGIDRLYWWLPVDIRSGLSTWSSLLRRATDDAIAWAHTQYDVFMQYAYGAYAYVLSTGETLKQWYNARHVLLDALAANPGAFLMSYLPADMQVLLGLTGALRDFHNNVWSRYRDILVNFVSNPFDWLYRRIETWVLDNLW